VKRRGCSRYLSRVKKVDLVPLIVLSQRFYDTFCGIELKNNMTGDNVLFKNCYLLGVLNFQSHAHERGF